MLDLSSYCEQHGYTYLRAVFPPPDDRMWGWSKADIIRQALQDFELLVICDFDVTVVDSSRPIETALSDWGFLPSHLLLAAEEPDRPYNKWTSSTAGGVDIEHANLNIGFMVLRNHQKVLDSLQLFSTCLETIPGCEHYRYGKTSNPDQAAWNIFILPTFLPSEVLRAPCSEANGYAEAWGRNDGCEGSVIHHAWQAKQHMADFIKARLMQQVYRGPSFSLLRSMLLARK